MKIIGETKRLIGDIDIFWDTISNSALTFRSGIKNYLAGRMDKFRSDLDDINTLENETDTMRREIKY